MPKRVHLPRLFPDRSGGRLIDVGMWEVSFLSSWTRPSLRDLVDPSPLPAVSISSRRRENFKGNTILSRMKRLLCLRREMRRVWLVQVSTIVLPLSGINQEYIQREGGGTTKRSFDRSPRKWVPSSKPRIRGKWLLLNRSFPHDRFADGQNLIPLKFVFVKSGFRCTPCSFLL